MSRVLSDYERNTTTGRLVRFASGLSDEHLESLHDAAEYGLSEQPAPLCLVTGAQPIDGRQDAVRSVSEPGPKRVRTTTESAQTSVP